MILKTFLSNMYLSTKFVLIRTPQFKALGKTMSNNFVKGIIVVVIELRSPINSEDEVTVMEDEVREDIDVEVMEPEVLDDDAVELVVRDGVPWNAVPGSILFANDPLIIVAFFRNVVVTVETESFARALWLGFDVGRVDVEGLEFELEAKVLVEMEDAEMLVALVVGGNGGNALFRMVT